jgi:hypothetical protein
LNIWLLLVEAEVVVMGLPLVLLVVAGLVVF